MASPSSGGTSHMLAAERANCSFDVRKLMALLGTDKRKQNRENALALFAESGDFNEPEVPTDYLSFSDRYTRSLQHAADAIKLVRDNPRFMAQHMSGKVQMSDMFKTNGIGIHFFMFLTFLKGNGTDEQKRRWLSLAMEGKFLGCYAQTELGHGSNLRGLETQATFDRTTDEFVIHSPTLTSLKWWPTGMYASTHAVVMANLSVDGVNCGVHGFMMQLRDERGMLMPGVEVGEMGPKIDSHKVNVGYARFTHVRIPRFNMFSKFFKVTREGEFVSPPPKLGRFKNISMMEVRVMIVGGAGESLGKAATIATRYSCVRKQGFKDTTVKHGAGSPEWTIMDYGMQQLRVFTALALSYSIRWSSRYIHDYLKKVQNGINRGDLALAEEMPELHATLCGLKAWSTIIAHGHMEDLRKACGGQGFLKSSGMPDIVEQFCDPATVEGEQVIMSLQCSRFLIKSVKQLRRGQDPVGSVLYLKDPVLTVLPFSSWDTSAPEDLVAMFRYRTQRKALRLADQFEEHLSNGMTFTEATNATAIAGYKAAACHSSYTVISKNLEALNTYVEIEDPACYRALMRLFRLTACYQIQQDASDFFGLLTQELIDSLPDYVQHLLHQIRPDAVGLVDAMGFSDEILNSTLGRYDGNVYEAIYREAKKSPLNKSPHMVGWEVLAPILDLDFLKEGIGQRVSSKL